MFVSGGSCKDEDIPHRSKLTSEIIEAWKRERKEFADDMKVSLTMRWLHFRHPQAEVTE